MATVEDYYRREMTSQERHELRDGRIVQLPGSTFRHSLIGANVGGACHQVAKGTEAVVLGCGMRLGIPAARWFVYADASIHRSPPMFSNAFPEERSALINPSVVFEVLDDRSEAFDRGEKFAAYRRLDSLQEYVLVSQHKPLVETFRRRPDGIWIMRTWAGLDAVVDLPSVGVRLPLVEIYYRVVFDGEGGSGADKVDLG